MTSEDCIQQTHEKVDDKGKNTGKNTWKKYKSFQIPFKIISAIKFEKIIFQ